MKKVALLTTGGTIASTGDRKTGLLMPGAVTGEQLLSMSELNLGIEVIVEPVFQLPSSHMTFEKLLQLKDRINQVLEDQSISGVVITHGTDTLEETAYFLDLTLHHERPVVVTGAQRGPFESGTDAFVNMRHAVLTAASEKAVGVGVLVVFNERIFAPRYVKKVHASNIAGFGARGYGYLGIVDHDEVYLYQKPIVREYYPISTIPPTVEFIKMALGVDGRCIEYAVQAGAKGIILEGLGRGHVPPHVVSHVAEAVEKGVKVVLTTSSDEGEVYPVYDFAGSVHDLMQKGVILGKDYDSKKARIKLAVLLTANVQHIQEKFMT